MKNIHICTMQIPTIDNQKNRSIKRVAIFASGQGSNAEKIIGYFTSASDIIIELIVCNRPGAGVIGIAETNRIAVLMIEKERFLNGDGYVAELTNHQIDFIVLAGFLWKIPEVLIENFRSKIINIHPALLPKYGGKGMYGSKVHEAVIASGDKQSGITIHYVDEKYDNGDVIFQATCPVPGGDTPGTLAERIHELEHAHFPRVVRECLDKI